jgi:hypothetical protein
VGFAEIAGQTDVRVGESRDSWPELREDCWTIGHGTIALLDELEEEIGIFARCTNELEEEIKISAGLSFGIAGHTDEWTVGRIFGWEILFSREAGKRTGLSCGAETKFAVVGGTEVGSF